ncbi:phosphoenolpyruvate--protein phosphotransferase [Labedaea rhizosphaerae]|uniref:Phosphoenolpyruvate-protein phosphotransferase n=1 Tax=Labedaea rhizosphaerae TaxID=598644 RepID=A0A4R6RX24_LABRH|nr:phosphoenolpyruvate--protein phosphotransferase [Labedaea rhizosphaerae]TDP91047.1 phosphoenolpyruvate--protein phosphotransferase [Labedaea rhizosphaerae]
MPERLTGYPASPGAVTGPAARLGEPPSLPDTKPAVTDPAAELARARDALATVAEELQRRAEGKPKDVADVLFTQSVMAKDPGLDQAVQAAISAGTPAPWAIREELAGYQDALRAAGGYLAERVADLDDIGDRALAVLLDAPMPGLPDPGHPYVLVAGDLSPADTATLDPAKVLAIVTERGGPTSHTVILARSLGLPAIVACPAAKSIVDGQVLAVDAVAGTVTVDPSADEIARLQAGEQARVAALSTTSGPGRTLDGHPVKLLLNVGAEGAGFEPVAAVDAEGVGLFRTEFLFLDAETAPGVEEQEAVYRRLFEGFAGRPVVVRTLDAGADKPLKFVAFDDEPNPALGVRGYRTATKFPELLGAQLTAIARAAAATGAQVQVMAPMVATAVEARRFVTAAHEHGIASAGVMIEVPAAALRARELLAVSDFVSIGTNDLSQYTFAADRMLGALGELLDPWQPALLQLVALVAHAGAETGKPVGICGEAAADPVLAQVFAGMGVTSLSMAPPAVAAVRAGLRTRTLAECRDAAERVLTATTPEQARAVLG